MRDLVEAKDLGIVAKGVMIANQMTGANAPEKIHIDEVDFVQMQMGLGRVIDALHAEGGTIPKLSEPEVIDADM